jgi:hypothetical protein
VIWLVQYHQQRLLKALHPFAFDFEMSFFIVVEVDVQRQDNTGNLATAL